MSNSSSKYLSNDFKPSALSDLKSFDIKLEEEDAVTSSLKDSDVSVES